MPLTQQSRRDSTCIRFLSPDSGTTYTKSCHRTHTNRRLSLRVNFVTFPSQSFNYFDFNTHLMALSTNLIYFVRMHYETYIFFFEIKNYFIFYHFINYIMNSIIAKCICFLSICRPFLRFSRYIFMVPKCIVLSKLTLFFFNNIALYVS